MTYKGDFIKIISYLGKQLELFSNLCFGRNYVNKRMMRQKLKSSVLLEYIWNKDLSQELRAAFVSLLLHVHIDSNPRTERIVPLKTKKFLFSDGKTPTKKRNQTNIFMAPNQNQGKSPDIQKDNNQSRLHDVVLDITKISTITKTLQNKVKDRTGKQEYAELDEPHHDESSSRGLQKENEDSDQKLEMIEEFLKEEESIDEEQIKNLKVKIIQYLEKEIYNKPKTGSKTVTIKPDDGIIKENKDQKNLNFDVLLLNVVQMVRKMVVCECFSFQERKELGSPTKKNFLKKNKAQPTKNEFEKLIKCLIVILEHQPRKNKIKRMDTNKLKNQPGMFTNLIGKLNNTMQDAVKETVKNVSQIFFKDSTKTKKNKKKKRASFMKLDSVSNFFVCGMNVKKKFLKNLGQNEIENYDVMNFFIYFNVNCCVGARKKRSSSDFAICHGYQT